VTFLDLDRPGWMELAACRGRTRLFYTFGDGAQARADQARAKAICRSCDVQAECLAHAISTNDEHGVWGGLDEKERRQVRIARTGRRRMEIQRERQLNP